MCFHFLPPEAAKKNMIASFNQTDTVNAAMEYLKRHLGDYEDATQKEPIAKRALIHTLYEVLSVAEKEVKDKATFDALFEKYMVTLQDVICLVQY